MKSNLIWLALLPFIGRSSGWKRTSRDGAACQCAECALGEKLVERVSWCAEGVDDPSVCRYARGFGGTWRVMSKMEGGVVEKVSRQWW